MADAVVAAVVSAAVSTAVSYLFPTTTTTQGPRLNDLNVVGSSYGAGIPTVFGRCRVPGNIIWARPLREVVTQRTTRAGKGSKIVSTEYSYFATFAALLCAGDELMRPLRIWADKKLIWQTDSANAVLSADLPGGGSFEFMPGGPFQPPSSIMESIEGAGSSPAYRGRSVIVFAEWPVPDSRGIPLIEVEVARGSNDASASVQDAIQYICTQAGLLPAEVDASAVTATVPGIVINHGPADTVLQSLLAAWSIAVVPSGSVLRFVPPSSAPAATITADDLVVGGDDVWPVKRAREDDLPGVLSVRYLDIDRDFQVSVQQARRHTANTSRQVSLDLPLVLTAAEAARLADSALYRIWAGMVSYPSVNLPPRFAFLEPGDVIRANIDGLTHDVRLRTLTIGANGWIQATGDSYDGLVIVGAYEGDAGAFDPQTLPYYGSTQLAVLDVPATNDTESMQLGVRIAAAGTGSAWRSGVIEESLDGGASYRRVGELAAPSVMGVILGPATPAPSANIASAQYDNTTAITVQLTAGSLSSATDAAVLAGANLAAVGAELIQFRSAALVGSNTYQLTGLLRGRRGTERHMGSHVPGERFVLLATAPFVARGAADIGRELVYRVTPSGGGTATTAYITFAGESARLFSPVWARASRSGPGDVTVTWLRRSKIGTELPNAGDIPLYNDVGLRVLSRGPGG